MLGMDGWRASFSRAVGFREYLVLEVAADVVNARHSATSGPFGEAWEEISEVHLPDIARVRPGYQEVASRYLNTGHRGFVTCDAIGVASMGWIYLNDTSRVVRVKGYFPVRPSEVYFHGDWTRPNARGRGLHLGGIYMRLQSARQSGDFGRAVANFEPDADSSVRNYKKLGFEYSGRSWSLGRGRTVFSSRKDGVDK